ncbi:asparagine synthase-related protein, partial [Planctomycetota bacterium]
RDMFKDFLPEETLRRDKQGFDIPIGEWFRDEYRDMFWDVIKTAFRKKGIIPKPVEKAYKDHIKEKQDNSRMLWSLFVWCWWWNKNF